MQLVKNKSENKKSLPQQAEGYFLSLKLGDFCRTKVWGIRPSLSNQRNAKIQSPNFIISENKSFHNSFFREKHLNIKFFL